MADDHVARALESDAPLTAAVPQHEIAKEAADAVGWDKAALSGRTVTVNLPREEVTNQRAFGSHASNTKGRIVHLTSTECK